MKLRCSLIATSGPELNRWEHTDIYYYLSMSLPGIPESKVDDIYKEACENWNRVCGINLRLGSPFNIVAVSKNIDGPEKTLGYSNLPQYPSKIKDTVLQVFDASEDWTEDWFLEVATHEVGHAIGILHSPDKRAIMYPYSHRGAITTPQEWDIEQAVLRYGKP